jgi:hypothetical protein
MSDDEILIPLGVAFQNNKMPYGQQPAVAVAAIRETA